MAVTTSYDSGTGTLTITGDAAADDIAIFGTSTAGEITIQGRNGTTVDGGASATIPGVTGDLVIGADGGNDVLNLDNVYLAGDLTIETGDGDDAVVFGATGVVSAIGFCEVKTDGGQDLFVAQPYKAFFGGNLVISDTNSVAAANIVGASAATIALFDLPQVFMQGVTSTAAINVRCDSTVNNIAIFTSAANDGIGVTLSSGQNSVYIDTCFSDAGISVHAYTVVFPGSGQQFVAKPAPFNIDDTITIARCQTRSMFVDTAGTGTAGRRAYTGGNDTVLLHGNYIVGAVQNNPGTRLVSVDTGDGNDTVTLSYNIALGDARFRMEDLDDTLILVGNQITGAIVADGGFGMNRLIQIGNQYPSALFSSFV
jgi:hypothetical protein